MSLSAETILEKGDRVRLVTYEEACEVCGAPEPVIGLRGNAFMFPESECQSDGRPFTLFVSEDIIRKYGGTVVTILGPDMNFGGSHIHYRLELPEDDKTAKKEFEYWVFCPTMFSGYEDDEPVSDDRFEHACEEDLFGFLFQ